MKLEKYWINRLLLGAIILAIGLAVALTSVFADSEITITSPKNHASVSLANAKVMKFYDGYKKGDGLKYYKKKEQLDPKPVTLTWKSELNYEGPFTITVSLDRNLEKDVKTYVSKNSSCSLKNLYAGKTYYWQISHPMEDGTATSEVFSFKTKNYPRTVAVSKVSNVRDLGGWKTKSGKRVRQGMVYRSARWDKVSSSGKKTAKELGIKTDLDLRRSGEGKAGKGSPLGKSTRYIHISAPNYSKVWKSKKQRKRLVKEMKVFTKEKNYPIVFHCTYGRDRTGTLAFTLNALLGVSKKDLYRDYELSFLSRKGSQSKKGGRHYRKQFDEMYKYMKNYKGKKKKVSKKAPLSKHVEQFLLDNGMSKKEIKQIRTLMLE